jgi:hypothetical protein
MFETLHYFLFLISKDLCRRLWKVDGVIDIYKIVFNLDRKKKELTYLNDTY